MVRTGALLETLKAGETPWEEKLVSVGMRACVPQAVPSVDSTEHTSQETGPARPSVKAQLLSHAACTCPKWK